MIVRFNERALAALGFDAPTIATLRHLLQQTGAVVGAPSLPDVIDGQGQDIDAGMVQVQIAELRKDFEELRIAIESGADGAELRKRLHALDIESAFPAAPTDWEHPGKLGDKTPNAVTSTTLTATAAVKLNPADQLVDLSPTGAGTVHVKPDTTGSFDNMVIGATTPKAATVTTLTSTAPAGTPPLAVASTTRVANLNVDRAGTADAANSLTSPTAFPADATDLPTVITLANALKAAALAKGL